MPRGGQVRNLDSPKLHVQVEPELARMVRELAAEKNQSVARVLEACIRTYFKARERLIAEGEIR